MSTRTLAIAGFLIFMVVFWIQTDAIRQAAGVRQPCPSITSADPPSLHRLETYALLIFNELAYENQLTNAQLKQAHPDLAPELRYKEFAASAAQVSVGAGMVKFRPLRAMFTDDYEALKTRYLAENPTAKLPD